MKELSGGQAAVASLQAEKVEHVFGLIGSATMEMFDALYDASDINFIGVHDERTGTHMADGYARASGNAGVILAGQNGPGATNLVTGLAQAYAAFSPVVSIAGSLSSAHVYRDAFQEVDQQALFKPITKKTWTVTQTARVPEMFREAFRTAMTPRRGPVQLNLPRDVLSETTDFPDFQQPASYRSQSLPSASTDEIRKAAEMLRGAEQPVIVIGGGIKNSGGHEDALALAESLNAPIILAPGHGDAIPFGHRLNAGQNGPGATNLVTGLAQAYAAFSPVVSIAGSLSSAHVYRDAFQEVDQQALFKPVTKKTWTVTQTARRAFRDIRLP
jgi:thiamine pyrophosphate-dependent acetolactate synthase large subunit-like protein